MSQANRTPSFISSSEKSAPSRRGAASGRLTPLLLGLAGLAVTLAAVIGARASWPASAIYVHPAFARWMALLFQIGRASCRERVYVLV